MYFIVLQFRAIAIIAEGIPENKTKLLIRRAREKGVAIVGPATVGLGSCEYYMIIDIPVYVSVPFALLHFPVSVDMCPNFVLLRNQFTTCATH